jgi:hypothetical protein
MQPYQVAGGHHRARVESLIHLLTQMVLIEWRGLRDRIDGSGPRFLRFQHFQPAGEIA